MNHIFAFCGPIGSGKSSVSKLVAQKIGSRWNSFGSTVREIAQKRGISTSREELQKLGAELVAKETDSFCRRVISGATVGESSPAVIDGLRHIVILKLLRTIAHPRPVLLVYIDVTPKIRLERVKIRDGLSATQLARLDSDSTEVEVQKELKASADLIADNNGSMENCVREILKWLERF